MSLLNQITLVGAGNSAHVCAAIFPSNAPDLAVQVLARSEATKALFGPSITCCLPHNSLKTANVCVTTDNEVIRSSKIVIWTGPVTGFRDFLSLVKEYYHEKLVVGTIFGQGLLHLQAQSVLGNRVKFFALRNIPWLCGNLVKGSQVSVIGGPKRFVEVGFLNLEPSFVQTLEPLFQVEDNGLYPKMRVLPDFVPIVFNPANQIIHPPVYFSIFKDCTEEGLPSIPEFLYSSLTNLGGTLVQALDDELMKLKRIFEEATEAKGCASVVPIKKRLVQQHGMLIKDKSSLTQMIASNEAYSAAKTPFLLENGRYFPNKTHRVVTDDIGYGLCVLYSIRNAMSPRPACPVTRWLIEWFQELMGKSFLVGDDLLGSDVKDLYLFNSGERLQTIAEGYS